MEKQYVQPNKSDHFFEIMKIKKHMKHDVPLKTDRNRNSTIN